MVGVVIENDLFVIKVWSLLFLQLFLIRNANTTTQVQPRQEILLIFRATHIPCVVDVSSASARERWKNKQ